MNLRVNVPAFSSDSSLILDYIKDSPVFEFVILLFHPLSRHYKCPCYFILVTDEEEWGMPSGNLEYQGDVFVVKKADGPKTKIMSFRTPIRNLVFGNEIPK